MYARKISQEIEKNQHNLQFNPNCTLTLYQLAKNYEWTKQFEQAVTCYRKVVQLQPAATSARTNLARSALRLGNIQEAIALYIKALAFAPTSRIYWELGDVLARNNQIAEAISVYKKAIKLKAYNPISYLKLVLFYIRSGELSEKFSRKLIRLIGKLSFEKEKRYLDIWNYLNQKNLQTSEENGFCRVNSANRGEIQKHFAQTSHYKIINLESLNEQEQRLIEEAGLSLTYLEFNKAGLITRTGIRQESPDSLSELHPKVATTIERTKFQTTMVEDGHLYAICPSTGRVLSSNDSFVSEPLCKTVFYRFVGDEVFYLITHHQSFGFPKNCLYFPRTELIIVLSQFLAYRKDVYPTESEFNQFKAYMVIHWQKVKSYLLDNEKKGAALIGYPHFAHYLWNELSGIHKLHESNSWHKLNQVIAVSEPFGSVEKIFPEIPASKINHIRRDKLTEEVLDNNHFICQLGHCFIKEDVISRIHHTALQQCSQDFLATVEEAKMNCFPLLWVTIRVDSKRNWISQEEGIANILKKLAERFPKLGVVFDGFTLPCDFSFNTAIAEIIKKETETVQAIRSHLPAGIKVYDTVGSIMYESIVWSHAIDLYIAHHGTLQLKVGWNANKPGVVHTNRQTCQFEALADQPASFARENAVVPTYIPEDCITDVAHSVKKSANDGRLNLNNYDCDWEVIYEEVLKLALAVDRG